MRTITTDIYEALALWYADDTRWLHESRNYPGTYCVSSAERIPTHGHWQLVSPEELELGTSDEFPKFLLGHMLRITQCSNTFPDIHSENKPHCC